MIELRTDHRQAENARTQAELRGQAEDARTEAEERREEAEQESRRAYRNYYVSQINLAKRDWEAADIRHLLERLKQTGPAHTGGEDPRGFEWCFLNRLCRDDLRTLKGHTAMVENVTFSPDGRRIASGCLHETTVKVWDASTGQEILTFKGHTDGIGTVTFSPDGRCIASGSADKTVKVWDASTGEVVFTPKGLSFVGSIAFSPDGQRIASGDPNRGY